MAEDKSKELHEEDEVKDDEVLDNNDEIQDDQQSKIDALTSKLDEMENKFLRSQAEIQNIQNHAKKEQTNLIKYEGQKLVTELLPIIDNLQRALSVKVDDENGKQLKTGVQMVTDHLIKALKNNGVEEIQSLNQPFDPQFHQAVQTIDADENNPKDTVVQVLQPGYLLKDRVLRPAMVVVAQ